MSVYFIPMYVRTLKASKNRQPCDTGNYAQFECMFTFPACEAMYSMSACGVPKLY